jgi:hypothetical protein
MDKHKCPLVHKRFPVLSHSPLRCAAAPLHYSLRRRRITHGTNRHRQDSFAVDARALDQPRRRRAIRYTDPILCGRRQKLAATRRSYAEQPHIRAGQDHPLAPVGEPVRRRPAKPDAIGPPWSRIHIRHCVSLTREGRSRYSGQDDGVRAESRPSPSPVHPPSLSGRSCLNSLRPNGFT